MPLLSLPDAGAAIPVPTAGFAAARRRPRATDDADLARRHRAGELGDPRDRRRCVEVAQLRRPTPASSTHDGEHAVADGVAGRACAASAAPTTVGPARDAARSSAHRRAGSPSSPPRRAPSASRTAAAARGRRPTRPLTRVAPSTLPVVDAQPPVGVDAAAGRRPRWSERLAGGQVRRRAPPRGRRRAR